RDELLALLELRRVPGVLEDLEASVWDAGGDLLRGRDGRDPVVTAHDDEHRAPDLVQPAPDVVVGDVLREREVVRLVAERSRGDPLRDLLRRGVRVVEGRDRGPVTAQLVVALDAPREELVEHLL